MLRWLVLDVLAAFALALGCAIASDYSTALVSYLVGPKQTIANLIDGLGYFLSFGANSQQAIHAFMLLYSSTTLVPTILRAAILALLLAAKPIADIGHAAATYLLGAHRSYEPQRLPVGTMCGACLAAFLSVIVLAQHTATWIAA